jgi:hypothetical protein
MSMLSASLFTCLRPVPVPDEFRPQLVLAGFNSGVRLLNMAEVAALMGPEFPDILVDQGYCPTLPLSPAVRHWHTKALSSQMSTTHLLKHLPLPGHEWIVERVYDDGIALSALRVDKLRSLTQRILCERRAWFAVDGTYGLTEHFVGSGLRPGSHVGYHA